MGRRCSVCAHASRSEIDAALVAGRTYRDVARQHGVSKDALTRHRRDHVAEGLTRAHQAAEAARGDDLLANKVTGLEADARRIAAAAEAGGDLRTALTGVRELTRIVELLTELRGEVNSGTNVNGTVRERPRREHHP